MFECLSWTEWLNTSLVLLSYFLYMLSTANLGSLGVCLMKYSWAHQRYGTVLPSLDFCSEISWLAKTDEIFDRFLLSMNLHYSNPKMINESPHFFPKTTLEKYSLNFVLVEVCLKTQGHLAAILNEDLPIQ